MENFFEIDSLARTSQRTLEGADNYAEASRNGNNSCKRHRGSENEQEDRLSSLPDSILLHILSFMPMEDAVKTVLLRRFGNLWTSVQTLDFDGRSYNSFSNVRHNMWFTNFVYHVLLLHDCPTIFRFSIKFGSYLYFLPKNIRHRRRQKPLGKEFSNNIDSWICFALRKKVKVLDMGILAHESSSSRFDYDLPETVLTSDSLTELKLVNICLGQNGQVHMKSLKSLCLTTIMLEDTMIEGILSGCPVLESLFIIKCYGLRKLNITSVHLKNLMVDVGEYELPGLEISGPNLMSLHISGVEAPLDLKNLSSLVDATLDLCFGYKLDDEYPNIGIILEKLHHANIFTISNWCILVMSFWELIGVHCPSSSRKCVVLKTPFTKWHLPGIISLLKTSPTLETLSIYIEADAMVRNNANDLHLGIPTTDEETFWNDEPWVRAYEEEEYMEYVNSARPSNCLTYHLKTVKISGRLSSPSLLTLVKFLLRYAKVLEEMVIIAKWNGQPNQQSQDMSKELMEFSQTLSSFSKASDCAVTLIS